MGRLGRTAPLVNSTRPPVPASPAEVLLLLRFPQISALASPHGSARPFSAVAPYRVRAAAEPAYPSVGLKQESLRWRAPEDVAGAWRWSLPTPVLRPLPSELMPWRYCSWIRGTAHDRTAGYTAGISGPSGELGCAPLTTGVAPSICLPLLALAWLEHGPLGTYHPMGCRSCMHRGACLPPHSLGTQTASIPSANGTRIVPC